MQPIHKYVRLLKRKTDITPEAFRARWLEAGAQEDRRALATTPVRRIIKSVGTGEVALGGAAPPFDAMLALYFDSLADARAICEGGRLAAHFSVDADFIDTTAPVQEMLADEYRMGEKADAEEILGGAGRLKIIRTVYRRHDLSQQQFRDYWLNNVAKSPVVRIVATFAVPDGLDGRTPPFDGMAELYFRTPSDIRSTFTSDIPAMMRKDEENFVQMDAPAIRFIANEYTAG
jgi:hypothetical protein